MIPANVAEFTGPARATQVPKVLFGNKSHFAASPKESPPSVTNRRPLSGIPSCTDHMVFFLMFMIKKKNWFLFTQPVLYIFV
ncbi:MAG: hypothetical protein NTY00_08890 [Deltaproteobacteria bacterium]|nr:hypothetical protein [Deltaproteobacteria bacterium]